MQFPGRRNPESEQSGDGPIRSMVAKIDDMIERVDKLIDLGSLLMEMMKSMAASAGKGKFKVRIKLVKLWPFEIDVVF